ncbi:HNH endonuclease [Aeromicrobium sp. Leaf291]|uniref:HNH endonuclease n=1 Tax=Aeromicrobium sp. Leaf291 TaxID=1736325 RepID=UPI0009EB783C|nr:HNH endonuclease [Aeromicrobium sp. Leaf291]
MPDRKPAGWRKRDLPFLIGDLLGIGTGEAHAWVSDGDTVEVQWHVDVGRACGVPYKPTKQRHMSELLVDVGVEWDSERHSSANAPSEGGGNLKREAYLDLYLALIELVKTDDAGPIDSWTMQAIRARRGQAQFREALVEAYGARCAVTGSTSLPVLEAAHIKPFAEGGEPRVANGVLLRTDVHTLFDLGVIRVRPDLSIEVDEKLSGTEYEPFDGRRLRVPVKSNLQPDRGALRERYEGATTTGVDLRS